MASGQANPSSQPGHLEVLRKMIEALSSLRNSVEYVASLAGSRSQCTDQQNIVSDSSRMVANVYAQLDILSQGIAHIPSGKGLGQDSVLGLLLHSSEDSDLYDEAVEACKWQTRAREATNIIDEMFRKERVAVTQTDPLYDVNDLRRFGRTNPDCDSSVTTEVMSLLENVAAALVTADRSDGMQVSAKRKSDCFIEMTVMFPSFTVDATIRGYLVETVRVRVTDNRRAPNAACAELCRQMERVIRAAAWHFADLFPPEQSTKSFLLWLRKQIAFSSCKCAGCGQTIRDGMPPLWRDSINNEAYHYDCRFDGVDFET